MWKEELMTIFSHTMPAVLDGVAGEGKLLRNEATVEDILDMFCASLQQKPATRLAYRKALHPFFNWMQKMGKNVSELFFEDLVAYKNHLQEPGRNLSRSTINLYLCSVRIFFSWVESHGGRNAARGIKSLRRERSSREGFKKLPLTETQAALLLEHFRSYHACRSHASRQERRFANEEEITLRNYAIVNLALRNGLRGVEICRLRVGDVSSKKGVRILKVWGKGHSEADDYVVLRDRAYAPIRDYMAFRPSAESDEPLFATVGYSQHGGTMNVRTVQMMIKEGLRAIGLDSPEYTPHSLRHTTGETLIRQGATLLEAQNALRHASPTTTQIYIDSIVEEKKLLAPAERLLDDCFDVINL